jgi:pimeloyl-ACP methyl ester carboxylesterase
MTSAMFEAARTAKVNGTTLAYCEQGEGEPVLFVHGGTADLRVWESQLPVVGRSYRAISYSQRFSRPNEAIGPSIANPFDPHVDDLAGLLREIGAAPAHLVGSSSGAFIALLAAIRYPELIRSLVLAEPPVWSLFVSTPPRAAELLKLFATRPRTAIAIMQFAFGTMIPTTRAFRRGDDEGALGTFLLGVLGKQSLSQLSSQTMQVLRDNISTLRGGLLHDDIGFPPLAEADVRSISVPALLITGQHSPGVFARMTDRLEELLPTAERVEIRDASHVPFLENAVAFNEALLAFLRRQRDS